MSEYIKKTWANGDVITPEALNNMETGITEAKKEAQAAGVAVGQKLGVLDIVNDLITNDPSKPLSAAQGVELKNLIDTIQAMGAKIQVGEYAGTGTFGKSNPNSLTFNFEPQVVFVYLLNYNDLPFRQMVALRKKSRAISYMGGFSSTSIIRSELTWAGNTLRWYYDIAAAGASSQLNESGKTYGYLAIG